MGKGKAVVNLFCCSAEGVDNFVGKSVGFRKSG